MIFHKGRRIPHDFNSLDKYKILDQVIDTNVNSKI